jgi:hypothetical protein
MLIMEELARGIHSFREVGPSDAIAYGDRKDATTL